MTAPNGCQHCGIDKRGHGRQYVPGTGWHQWTPPTQAQIKQRMTDRRNAHPANGDHR